jgi:hypothetical protein
MAMLAQTSQRIDAEIDDDSDLRKGVLRPSSGNPFSGDPTKLSAFIGDILFARKLQTSTNIKLKVIANLDGTDYDTLRYIGVSEGNAIFGEPYIGTAKKLPIKIFGIDRVMSGSVIHEGENVYAYKPHGPPQNAKRGTLGLAVSERFYYSQFEDIVDEYKADAKQKNMRERVQVFDRILKETIKDLQVYAADSKQLADYVSSNATNFHQLHEILNISHDAARADFMGMALENAASYQKVNVMLGIGG